MVRKGEYRARAQRLLTGSALAQDLTTLLLFLRQKSFGCETVRDVGHMLGHADARTKGLSVGKVNEHFSIASFHKPGLTQGPGRIFNMNDAPPGLPAVMDATFKLIGDDILRRETGLSRAQASTCLHRIKRKFAEKGDGRLTWIGIEIKENELSVLNLLTTIIIVEPAYSGERFFTEFSSLLVKHGFLNHNQESDLRSQREPVILFALAAMHGVRFTTRDGSSVEAEAGWASDSGEALMNVMGNMQFEGLGTSISFPIFETDLKAADWCEEYNPDRRHVSWIVPIELTSEGRIRTIS